MTTPPAPNARRVALITGAGSGIGRATARLLSGAGYALALAGRREEALRETGHLLATPWLAIPTDLRNIGEVEAMVDRAVEHFGRLDALINNAGYSPAATIAQTTPAIAAEVYAVNALAPTIAISRAWPTFERLAKAEGRGGVVVNLSSYATLDPFPILYAYAGAKAAVNLLAKCVANEGRALGVRGFAVAPGAVETDLLRSLVNEEALPRAKTLPPEAVATVIAECVRGERDGQNGEVIWVPSPS